MSYRKHFNLFINHLEKIYNKTKCLKTIRNEMLKNNNIQNKLLLNEMYEIYLKEIGLYNICFNNDNSYDKRLIYEGEYLNYYLILWDVDGKTKLHNHNTRCIYKICDGIFKEEIIKKEEKEIINTRLLKMNNVDIIEKTDYHKLTNLSDYHSMTFNIYEK